MFNVLAYGHWTKVSLSWAKYLAARAVNGKNRAKYLAARAVNGKNRAKYLAARAVSGKNRAKYLAAQTVNGKNRAKLLVNINERGVAICDAGEYSPCIRIE